MRKIVINFLVIALIVSMLYGCGLNERKNNNNETEKLDQWKCSYVESLRNHQQNSNNTVEFILKDLDGKDVPELLVREETKLTIYTFTDKAEKIESHDWVTGTTRLLYSNNSSYPGIFYFYVSGGLNHYGYMNIEDGKLKYEELWNEDYSGISKEIGEKRDRIKELSKDKKLILESQKVYDENCDLIFKEIKSNLLNTLENSIEQYIIQ